MKNEFENKNILITGGTGSLGKWVIAELLKFNPGMIRVLDIDETAGFNLENKYTGVKNLKFFIGDIRDKDRIKSVMEDIDIVFHFAALKHVMACEFSPFEAIKTNVYGMQNIIEAALQNNVEKVIFTSSDKAANPDNTMGATKLLGERLMTSANYYKGKRKTVFACVRFGNVMGTRGSVIPLFKKQIENNEKITITNPNMTRFMMSLDQAMKLIFKCTKLAKGGEIFIFKMPVFGIGDLALTTLSYYGRDKNNLKIIGIRPGETMYEELMTEEESMRAVETDEMFIIAPFENTDLNSFENEYNGKKLPKPTRYDSRYEKPLNKDQMVDLLKRTKLI